MAKDARLRRSQSQESRVARTVGGVVQPGSGSRWNRPNDVRDSENLRECKRTDKKSITVKLTDLEAVRKRAALDGRKSVMHLEFGKRCYVVIPEEDHLAMEQEIFELKALLARDDD